MFYRILILASIFPLSLLLSWRTVEHFKANVSPFNLRDVPDQFLSVALDNGLVREKWSGFNFNSKKLLTLAQALSPAYMRLGGTAADYMLFVDDIAREKVGADPKTEFNITRTDIVNLYKFTQKAGWRLLLDLNQLLRHGARWDPSNPVKLLEFMATQGMLQTTDLELGNEPNSYKHSANVSISTKQLGEDFLTLVDIVRTNPALREACRNCRLVGPDVTRPKLDAAQKEMDLVGIDSPQFLQEYLSTVNGSLDAVTWHQYYVNGRTATVEDFTSAEVLDYLPQQIRIINETMAKAGYHGYPMWLGETSSAYGGGAPGLSDRYVAGFLWLDKLGVAARDGVDIVIRQSFYHGNYALLDSDTFDPRPDYWLSLVFKKLVGQRVLNITIEKQDTAHHRIRLYAHCTGERSGYQAGSVVIYGINLYEHAANISVSPLAELTGAQSLDRYLLTPSDGLQSKYIRLNGHKLKLLSDDKLPSLEPDRWAPEDDLHFPAQTFGFYVYSGANFAPCL